MRSAAQARGLTVRQAVTLASIVEKETAKPDERPLVAAVYSTRLRVGMPLQCDPTGIYALAKAGRYDGNIHKADLSIDSPYTPYRYPGLPPGPIASPGRASLEAAVHPAAADYLYFVSRNDGSHEFARTLDEHNRNVRKYQIDYFRAHRTDRTEGTDKTDRTDRTDRKDRKESEEGEIGTGSVPSLHRSYRGRRCRGLLMSLPSNATFPRKLRNSPWPDLVGSGWPPRDATNASDTRVWRAAARQLRCGPGLKWP